MCPCQAGLVLARLLKLGWCKGIWGPERVHEKRPSGGVKRSKLSAAKSLAEAGLVQGRMCRVLARVLPAKRVAASVRAGLLALPQVHSLSSIVCRYGCGCWRECGLLSGLHV